MRRYFLPAVFMLLITRICFAELNIAANENFSFTVRPYLQVDVISLKNAVDLDSKNKSDQFTYLGIDYSLAFNLNFKEKGPSFYLKLERNGPWDYDAPLFIDGTLTVTGPQEVKAYRNEELLPQAEEFWFDLPVFMAPIRLKAGLFGYEVGKGFSSGSGTLENYGLSLYHAADNFSWRFHYFKPDLVYKSRLGPRVQQDIDAGMDWEPNLADYFTLDAEIKSKAGKFQPFAALLLDNTAEAGRVNYFTTPTNHDALTTIGLDYDITIKGLSFGLEIARNFGKAGSKSDEFKDVEHKGYLIYSEASYDIGRLSPHASFLFSSGNKVTTDMVNNGDTTFTSGANKAFSIYSPLNNNIFDSLGPSFERAPLVFLGWGYGYSNGIGVDRPSTLADDSVLENLVMPSVGCDYKFTEKLSMILDWWYIRANERGVGSLGGIAKELPRGLGQEIDLTFSYDVNKNLNVSLYGGYFFPGKFFKEERDDVDGSLFTPFVRGDGKADGAYQIELVTIFEF